MAQSYPRKTLSVFGADGTTDDFEQFGSTAVAATNYTKDIATIQTLAAWTNGWRPALVTAKAPILQDMNAVQYVHSYMQGSVFEEGIPEWDAGTTYSFGSVVKLPYTGGNNFQIFVSLADSNLNNALPTAPASNGSWQYVFGFVSGIFTMGTSIGFGATSTEGIIGTVTNDSAAAGNVGEAVRGLGQTLNAAATTVYLNITSIALTAGDWDLSGIGSVNVNSAGLVTGSNAALGISANIGTPMDLVDGDNLAEFMPPTTAAARQLASVSIPNFRVSISGSATYYLKGAIAYSSGTPIWYGRLSARRAR